MLYAVLLGGGQTPKTQDSSAAPWQLHAQDVYSCTLPPDDVLPDCDIGQWLPSNLVLSIFNVLHPDRQNVPHILSEEVGDLTPLSSFDVSKFCMGSSQNGSSLAVAGIQMQNSRGGP